MAVIERDPASGVRYTDLPWRTVGLDLLADATYRDMMCITHWALVDEAQHGATVVERLTLLATVVADRYAGLEAADGEPLAVGWRTLLADLAACPTDARAGWVAVYGESTGGWWPPGSSKVTCGVVNAVLRSPEVEALHTSDRDTFYSNQLGTFCANWAGVSLLDGLVELADPNGWGLDGTDVARAATRPRYTDALTRFPVAAAAVTAAGRCLTGGTANEPFDMPDGGTDDEAVAWLAGHAGPARSADHDRPLYGAPAGADGVVTVRHAWTAPPPDELERFRRKTMMLPTLTRLSRDPRHLAAVLQWCVRNGTPVITPNLLIDDGRVSLRRPFIAPPAADVDPAGGQRSHASAWTDLAGLSDRHAAMLQAVAASTGRMTSSRPGRNDPCPCGSGRKYKHCHGRPS